MVKCVLTELGAASAPIDHDAFMQEGVRRGWWVMREGDREPWQVPKTLSLGDAKQLGWFTMAHVMSGLGVFPSIKEARRNGWNFPVRGGNFLIKNKRLEVIVTP